MGDNPISSVDMRKVTNGYVARITRKSSNDPLPMMQAEERVFTTYSDLTQYLTEEGFAQ